MSTHPRCRRNQPEPDGLRAAEQPVAVVSPDVKSSSSHTRQLPCFDSCRRAFLGRMRAWNQAGMEGAVTGTRGGKDCLVWAEGAQWEASLLMSRPSGETSAAWGRKPDSSSALKTWEDREEEVQFAVAAEGNGFCPNVMPGLNRLLYFCLQQQRVGGGEQKWTLKLCYSWPVVSVYQVFLKVHVSAFKTPWGRCPVGCMCKTRNAGEHSAMVSPAL